MHHLLFHGVPDPCHSVPALRGGHRLRASHDDHLPDRRRRQHSVRAGIQSALCPGPGLGFTTLFTHTLCQKYGYTWQQALALVLISGVLFLALALSPLLGRLNDAIPLPFRFDLFAGVGLFLTLSGLINAGLITVGENLVDMGTLPRGSPCWRCWASS